MIQQGLHEYLLLLNNLLNSLCLELSILCIITETERFLVFTFLTNSKLLSY